MFVHDMYDAHAAPLQIVGYVPAMAAKDEFFRAHDGNSLSPKELQKSFNAQSELFSTCMLNIAAFSVSSQGVAQVNIPHALKCERAF